MEGQEARRDGRITTASRILPPASLSSEACFSQILADHFCEVRKCDYRILDLVIPACLPFENIIPSVTIRHQRFEDLLQRKGRDSIATFYSTDRRALAQRLFGNSVQSRNQGVTVPVGEPGDANRAQ
jgi:hypothetical protein